MQTKAIAHIHHITQDHALLSHAAQARNACAGGITWVQFRMKNQTDAIRRAAAVETQQVCQQAGARFIVNDYVNLALDLKADGLHLGKTDMPVEQAREILGPDAIIGATANSWFDVEALLNSSADYIGLGPFRFTATKENLSPILGAEGIAAIAKAAASRKPLVAIGGIRPEDIFLLYSTGVYGLAVSSGINLDPQPDKASALYIQSWEEHIRKSDRKNPE
jgi:thiamine-phosphate pyrophosphorylase